MLTPAKIEELKLELKDHLSEGIGYLLLEMKRCLPRFSKKYDDLISVEAWLNEVNRKQNRGLLDYETVRQEYARITQALLDLINSLEARDFQVQGQAVSDKKSKYGSILYQIPSTMRLDEETRCIVRLAFLEEWLLENIELTEDTQIKTIRVAEIMGVELLDLNAQPAFNIRTPNSPTQFLDEDDYTEWVFLVKPLLEGVFPLVLKVIVEEERKGKTRKKEIVLEEKIQIVTGAVAQDAAFQTADYQFTKSTAISRSTIPTRSEESELIPPKRSLNSIRRYAPILAFLLITAVGAMAAGVPREIQWQIAQYRDTPTAYRNFIEKYEDKGERHIESAYFEKAISAAEQDTSVMVIKEFEEYLEKYEPQPAKSKASKVRTERFEVVEQLYFDKTLEVANVQQDITPLTQFMSKYGKEKRNFITTANSKVLEVATISEDTSQLKNYLSVIQSAVPSKIAEENTSDLSDRNNESDFIQIEQFQAALSGKIEEIVEYKAVKQAVAQGNTVAIEAFKEKYPDSKRISQLNQAATKVPSSTIVDTVEHQPLNEELEPTIERTETPKPVKKPVIDNTSKSAKPTEDIANQNKDASVNESKKQAETPTPSVEELSTNTDTVINATEPDTTIEITSIDSVSTSTAETPKSDIPIPTTVLVKGGTYIMGCLEGGGEECEYDEKPSHKVTLSNFHIGRYEVTNEEFAAFLNEKGNQEEGGAEWVNLDGKSGKVECGLEEYETGKFRAKKGLEKHPMIYVSWYGAKAYTKWLSEKTNQRYRLPSEAEWEYAAKGGFHQFSFQYAGSNELDEIAWYDDNSDGQTHTVGQKKPNALGLFDMSGNVYEWCEDRYGDYEPYSQSNPKGAFSGTERVLRGGSWNDNSRFCRASHRLNSNPNNHDFNLGFRVVRA